MTTTIKIKCPLNPTRAHDSDRGENGGGSTGRA
jgi:hypothetical protein